MNGSFCVAEKDALFCSFAEPQRRGLKDQLGVDAFERKRILGTGAPLFSGVDDAGGARLLVYGSLRK